MGEEALATWIVTLRNEGADEAFAKRFAKLGSIKLPDPRGGEEGLEGVIDRALSLLGGEDDALLLHGLHRLFGAHKAILRAATPRQCEVLVGVALREASDAAILTIDARRDAANVLFRLLLDRRKETSRLINDAFDAVVLDVARSVPNLDDYELQELVLDALYMLWRAWSKGSVATADRLAAALHPRLEDCMVATYEGLKRDKTNFQQKWNKAQREALVAIQRDDPTRRLVPLSMPIHTVFVACDWISPADERVLGHANWLDCSVTRLKIDLFDDDACAQKRNAVVFDFATILNLEIHSSAGPSLVFEVPRAANRHLVFFMDASLRPPKDYDKPIRVRVSLRGTSDDALLLDRAAKHWQTPSPIVVHLPESASQQQRRAQQHDSDEPSSSVLEPSSSVSVLPGSQVTCSSVPTDEALATTTAAATAAASSTFDTGVYSSSSRGLAVEPLTFRVRRLGDSAITTTTNNNKVWRRKRRPTTDVGEAEWNETRPPATQSPPKRSRTRSAHHSVATQALTFSREPRPRDDTSCSGRPMRRAASKARMNMNNILLALGRRVPSEHTIPRQPPVDDVALSRAANHNYAVVQATPTDDDDDDDYDDARETTTRAVRTPAARPRRQAESGDHESHLFTPAARRRRAEPVGREDHGSTAAHPRQKEPRLEVSARSRADLMLHIRAPPAHEPNDEPHPMNEARNDAPVPDSSDEVNVPPRSAPTHHPPWIGNDAVAPEEETRQREEPLHDQVEQTMKNARAVPRAEDDRNEPETIEPTEVPPRPTYGQTRHHRRDDQCPLTTTNIQTSSESADEQPAVQSSRDSRLSANPGNRLRKRRRQGPSETTPRVTQNITRTLICSCNGAGCDICGGRRNVPRVEAVPLVDSPPMTPEMTEKEMMDLESLSVMRLKQHADRLGVEPDDDPRQKHTWITAIRRAVARETTTSNASTAISPETASRTEPNLPVNVPSQHNDHATTSGGGAAAATSTRVPASLATQRVDETPPHRSVPDSADEGETARRDASDDRDNEQLVAKTPCAEATVEALPLVTPNATGQPADERDDDDSSRTSTQHDEEAVVPPPAYKASYPGALIDGGVLDITGFAELFGNISNEQTLQSAIAAAKSAWQNPRCRRGWEVLEAATQPQANDAARDVYKMSRAVLMLLQFADHVNHATKSREVGRTRNGC